jgi:hypothetical protein
VTLRDPVTVQLARLQDENADLRARNRDLEALLNPTMRFPLAWRLTVQQTQIMSLLVSREFVAHETARCVVLDKESINNPQKQLVVQITHIRKKLSAFGIGIHTVWGQGYLIEPKTKQRIFREIEAAHERQTVPLDRGGNRQGARSAPLPQRGGGPMMIASGDRRFRRGADNSGPASA